LEGQSRGNNLESSFGEEFTIRVSRIAGSRRWTEKEKARQKVRFEEIQSVLFPTGIPLKGEIDKHRFKELGVTLGLG